MKTLGSAGNPAVTFTYDAEGRVTGSTGSGVTVKYYYDGEGNRFRKVVGSAVTAYAHDAFGSIAAEYTNTAMTPACVTCYLSYDHLGSLRMVTDQNSNVVARHDYLPYGEEMAPAPTAGRSGNGFGVTANVNQKYTGQERDPEMTPNSDFFNARYFSAVAGSFLRPDPGNAGASLGSPQSWNGYGYVGGNPLSFTDPTGEGWWSSFWNSVESFFGFGASAAASVAVGVDQQNQNQNPVFFFSTETTAYQSTIGSGLPSLNLDGLTTAFSSAIGDVSPYLFGRTFYVTGTGVADRNPQPVSTPTNGGLCGKPVMQQQYIGIFGQMGRDLNVKPQFIMTTAVQESGWELSHVYGTNRLSHGQPLNNLFGAAPGGGNNKPYASVWASAVDWERSWGPQLRNNPQTIQDYVKDLLSVPHHMYNTNPGYPKQMYDTYSTVMRAVNTCGTVF